MTGYAALAELAEARLDLARAAEWTALSATDAQRVALVAACPVPGPADRSAIARALAAEEQVARLATEGIAGARQDLARLRRGRGAVRGYGQLAAAAPTGALA